ncbi:hypothetical protein HK101_001729 [Irineochytrium annulatum]|nr:hypothetical protein HK101_001729 [Irineochytrium annulatum]
MAFPPPAALVDELGPIKAVSIPGRGNALVATAPVPAGSTLLLERPILSWPRGAYHSPTLASKLMRLTLETRQPGQPDITSTLFPASVDVIPPGRRSQYSSPHLQSIVAAGTLEGGALDGNTWTEEDALRHLYLLDCNSFPSGLLLALSYCNHSCAPNSRVTELPHAAVDGVPSYRLDTLRALTAGEEVTISYLDPLDACDLAEDRRRSLEEHYLFECACEWCVGRVGEFLACGVHDGGGLHPATGVCDVGGEVLDGRELEKWVDRAERLVLAVRRECVDGNAIMDVLETESESLKAFWDSGGEAQMSPAVEVALEDERPRRKSIKFAEEPERDARPPWLANLLAVLPNHDPAGLMGRAGLLSLVRERAKALEALEVRGRVGVRLHATHLAFASIERCLARMREWIAETDTKASRRKGRKGKRTHGGGDIALAKDIESLKLN